MPSQNLTYKERAKLATHPLAKQLFEIIEAKKSNLVLSLDVTKKGEFLELLKLMAPFISVLKTHIDIIEDFNPEFTLEIEYLAKKYNFLIFEDRKFADIGNTVKLQYQGGIFHIANWAHIVNAHSLFGFGVVKALKEVGSKKNRALLLLAEASVSGNLITEEYTKKTVELAHQNLDFVIGFISQRKLSDNPGLIHFTPGVQLQVGTDPLGQNYRTPHQALYEDCSDLIIVGRGIYEDKNPVKKAEEYRDVAWNAYLSRLER